MKKVIIGLILLITILGCSSDAKLEIQKDSFTVELGNPVSLKASTYLKENLNEDVLKEAKVNAPFLKETDKYDIKDDQIKTKDKEYLNVGNYAFTVQYKKQSKDFKVIVQDTTKPEFVEFKNKITLDMNTADTDLVKHYKAQDLSYTTISIEYDKNNPFDITKEGTYKITVIAIDEYKNVTQKVCEVVVIDNTVKTPTIKVPVENKIDKPQTPSNSQKEENKTPATNSGSENKEVVPEKKPNVCEANGQWQMISNSGKAWYAWEDADAWADTEVENPSSQWYMNSYNVYTTKDNCGTTGYTVSFRQLNN